MATNAPQTKHVKIDIKGMTCAACSASVERALRRADGVLQVNVNLATNSATVLCEDVYKRQVYGMCVKSKIRVLLKLCKIGSFPLYKSLCFLLYFLLHPSKDCKIFCTANFA